MRSPDPMTQLEIARILGVSRQRVAQWEASALAKLRAAFNSGATGPASLFLADLIGVPEPTGDPHGRRGDNGRAAAARRTKGRYA
jgi:transcriptional regulator with XRE-family HTH domain